MTPPRVSVWIPGDQLLLDHPALQAAATLTDRAHTRVVLVESAQRLARLPYQRKKLVLLLSAMRHYVEELRAVGYTVEYRQAASVGAGLRAHVAAWQPQRLFTMATAEYSGRSFQQRLTHLLGAPVTVLTNTQFLTGRYDPFSAAAQEGRVGEFLSRPAQALGTPARRAGRTAGRRLEL